FASRESPKCESETAAPATVQITVTAQPEDTEFTIAVNDTTPFATCISEKLQRELQNLYYVKRMLPDGHFERYFRIDAAVSEVVTVPLASTSVPEQRRQSEPRFRKNSLAPRSVR